MPLYPVRCSKGIRTNKYLVRKRTFNHLPKLASLDKWLSVRLRNTWLWVRIPMLSLNITLFAKYSVTFEYLLNNSNFRMSTYFRNFVSALRLLRKWRFCYCQIVVSIDCLFSLILC